MNARTVNSRRTDFQSVRAARRTDCQSVLPLCGRLSICPTARRGFTLVELLVVIVILTMLSAFVVVALRGAQQSAREAKTKATIAKLHGIVMEIYESYRTRRVPSMSDAEMQAIAKKSLEFDPATMPWTLNWVARVRLAAMRDIMRMEMPERWTDIQNGPQFVPVASEPALHRAYWTRCARQEMDGTFTFLATGTNYPAKCLYLVVTMAGGEDARSQFAPDEVAIDPDDGFCTFIDGWGRPIYFLRWAPGFNDSDVQPNIGTETTPSAAAASDHDPFDTRRVDPAAWKLLPLIYSAGRGGENGVWVAPKNEPSPAGWPKDKGRMYVWTNNTYNWIWDDDLKRNVLMGQPIGSTHFDNIHNHRIEAQ